ncbi:Phosphotransferase enzyme [Aspergillus nanangensis]|uniref:Phosphotransferase enzyme n=1 Tax=Aspergillus nanangensis TaxID=2582783 RepID=A0AAD4CXR7_ASPNN|nr:Phosphotransferase enzyme [Aspergillus nanangensis]
MMNLGARHSPRLELQQLNSYTANLLQPWTPRFSLPLFRPYLPNAAGRNFWETLAVRTKTTYKGKMTSHDPLVEQLFRYTSGRWLWDEEQQVQDRYKAFNVPQLQNLAAQATGSNGCDSITKLAEGGFNKVFRLNMNDGKTILARIPNPNAGPSFYTTASEVATMEFARDVLQIPVPRILGWSASPDNPVGSEYIFMEEATGTQLAIQWDGLNPDAKLAIMREVVAIETKLLSVSFSHYGSIYFASDAVDGAVPAQITSVAPSELKELVSKKYTIGPTVVRDFWKKERSVMNISRGPWSIPEEYASSIGWRELEWIKAYAVPKAADDSILVSTAQNNPQEHLRLLEKYLSIVPCLMDVDPLLSQPTLWHGDLHSSNFFVEKNIVTAVIDWQGSWAGPLFLQAEPSPLVDYQGSVLLKRPDNFDRLDPEKQVQIKRQIFKSTLFQLYLMETEKCNPLLAKAFHLDHGKTRRLAFELAGNTWDDEIVSFRESLINVERHWKELCHQGDCPYHFTEEELKSHAADADGWNEVQDFFDSIDGLVKRDGWTHPETFDAAFNFFSHLRKLGLKGMKGEERDVFDKQTSWAKD